MIGAWIFAIVVVICITVIICVLVCNADITSACMVNAQIRNIKHRLDDIEESIKELRKEVQNETIH